jgi:hypothetical protein
MPGSLLIRFFEYGSFRGVAFWRIQTVILCRAQVKPSQVVNDSSGPLPWHFENEKGRSGKHIIEVRLVCSSCLVHRAMLLSPPKLRSIGGDCGLITLPQPASRLDSREIAVPSLRPDRKACFQAVVDNLICHGRIARPARQHTCDRLDLFFTHRSEDPVKSTLMGDILLTYGLDLRRR